MEKINQLSGFIFQLMQAFICKWLPNPLCATFLLGCFLIRVLDDSETKRTNKNFLLKLDGDNYRYFVY